MVQAQLHLIYANKIHLATQRELAQENEGMTLTNHFTVWFDPDLVSRVRGDYIQSGRSQGQHTTQLHDSKQ